jgi:hypothetical protein
VVAVSLRLFAHSLLFGSCLMLSTALSAQAPARLGTIDFPTSASGPAQREFVTGVLYLHSFEYPSAAAAFRRAQQLDASFALAYWGEAMTYTHPVWNEQDTAAARAALRRLAPTREARAAKAPTARERAYLDAVETLYGEGTKAARDTAYAEAMQRVAAAYADDVEAKAFFALALLGLNQGARDGPTYMRAGAIAAEVFETNPRHPGAAHYLIHAFDDPVHAPLGLRAARAYSSIAPDAAHAQHMTSHIFVAMGMWDETVGANEVAARATRDTTREWARRSCGHYGEWLQYGYFQQGRPGAASQLFEECRIQATAARGPRLRASLAGMRAVQIVESEQWDGTVVKLAIDTTDLHHFARAFLDFGTGYAAAKRGDWGAVRSALSAISAHAAATPAEQRGYAIIMRRELDALVALAAGRKDDAVAELRRAVAVEDSLPVDFGPPIDVKPPRELLGETLVQIGRAAEGRRELELQLTRTPGRARTLLALARAATAMGDRVRAEAAYRDLARQWKNAEPGGAELAEVRRAVAVAPNR